MSISNYSTYFEWETILSKDNKLVNLNNLAIIQT